MSRVSPFRLCAAAGLAVGTAAVGLAMAPAALAAEPLPELEGPDTAVIGEPFQLTGTGCDATVDGKPAAVYVDYYTAAGWDDPDGLPVFSLAGAPADGAWTALAEFTPAAEPGDYVAVATCEPYSGSEAPLAYPDFTFSLEAAPTTPPVAPPDAPAPGPGVLTTGDIRGVAANTPGVASPDTGAATGDRSVAGQKVVKILTGFQPYEVVTVTLHSTPTRLGTFTADASGTVRIEFTVPAGTPVGDHTLVYEGDQGTYFQESFTVAAAASATGTDGDLAYTGASVALPLGLGAGALALGGGLVFLTRRRAAGAVQG
ncbi:hypothetical protein SAMN05660359_04517 [Geodermatophilus obscurus]|uniref:LPXTG-motif cell wall anchor domain-containing protein n=1 Tax=Geodermatophilus obscurus TaxID=1861 RepID=A0A1I5ICV2_9ACTN|nr:hypothetical protein [Geodermatophilus obscurus]SFO58437.1 hypothetical protein SAMN05660359_04517 [Geodermatophilus obscurus]